ncbi:cytochrome P450 4V2-like [Stegodyphus dumicola]|uniref:cytochrome P450 4V2-like n=1 Tax=Stegodyphus dumicola TaxID=202533 RepID=UPI0015B2B2D4|nr:cytochrome P450 4V2-like [Stegodyphus dumicola]
MLEFISTGLPFHFVCILFFGALLFYFARIFFKRRRLVNIIEKLPSFKLRFYHIFGHVQLLLPHRLVKKQWPPNVYDFIALNGYNHVFNKESITNLWQFYIPFVSVYKADAVEMVLNHSTELKKAWFYDLLHPWLGSGLLTSYDEKWRSRRKLLTPAFHFHILKDFLPAMNKQSKILANVLKNHTEDEYVDIVPFISKCSLDIICESILGVEVYAQTMSVCPYLNAVTALTNEVFERMQSPWLWPNFLFRISSLGRKFKKNLKILQDFTNAVIAEKKKEKIQKHAETEMTVLDEDGKEHHRMNKRALLDLLLDEHLNNNAISETEIREEVDTFTFEGHDTTSLALSWSVYMIGLHPWVQDRIHEELDSVFGESDRDVTVEDLKNLKYLECVIKETLRLYPSVAAFAREIREDMKFHDLDIPRGATCVVLSYLLHRDPEVFPNPEKFDPDRFLPENTAGRNPFAYVPFSAGPRNCIGQRFALMEVKTVLSFILRRYRLRSLDPRDKIQLVDEIVLRPLNGLRIEIKPRHQTPGYHPPYYYP